MSGKTKPSGRRPQPAKKGASTTVVNKQKPTGRGASQPENKIPKAYLSAICGLADPFCTHAIGAKYPDNSPVRTNTYSARGSTQLVVDTGGEGTYLFMPQYSYGPLTYPSTGSGSLVTAWTAFPAYSPIADVANYRINSVGFTLKCTLAPLNASGMVYLRGYATEDLIKMGAVDVTTYNASWCKNVPLRLMDDTAVLLQHTSQLPQVFYRTINDNTAVTNSSSKGFAPVTIYINGAPASSAPITIEWVINYELVFEDSSGSAQMATPPPPMNAQLTTAANYVTSTIAPIFTAGIKETAYAVEQSAKYALLRAIRARLSPYALIAD